eukprot:574323-Pyramimonas_sp.AAC.1
MPSEAAERPPSSWILDPGLDQPMGSLLPQNPARSQPSPRTLDWPTQTPPTPSLLLGPGSAHVSSLAPPQHRHRASSF